MYSSILNQIKTKDDADLLLGEIDILLRSLYDSGGGGFDSVMATKIRASISNQLSEIFSKNISLDKKVFLEGLRDVLGRLEEVGVTLSFEPSRDTIERLANFVKKQIGESAVLNIGCDPSIIGGAVIIYKGKYKDFSFRRIFETVFQQERKDILKLLSRGKG